ncbi:MULTISPECIES: class I SAM-dependent methyltransferase [Protofrankia]|uniref:Methyltransferase type 11 n=1 Tax=Candidatus Protofrankia datiscae TaxID=2716812 RepID=F8B3F9_9ACTN|nr:MULTISPECIES: class I SAM-dependent methyltransferase [Protofrankia]AEH09121.1 Methyltransferase type 11 [Candidatus Protofrankia datiscae]
MGIIPDYRTRIYDRYTTEKLPYLLELTDAEYRRWAAACQHRLRGWLPSDREARCLDVACGHGNFLYLLKEAGYHNIVGIDVSPEQAAVARRVWPDVECANVLDYLPGHAGEFDLITGFDIIEHLHKSEVLTFLDLISKALRPGGSVILQTANAESPWGGMHRYHDFTHETGYDPASLDHLFRVVGLEGFEARECGPYIHGAASMARTAIWKVIHAGLSVWNVAETGSRGSGVYTRIFAGRAQRPAKPAPHHYGTASVESTRLASPTAR